MPEQQQQQEQQEQLQQGGSWSSRLPACLHQPLVQAVLLAQCLSILLVCMGVTSGVLAARGINAAATQSLLNYALLTVVCGAVHARRSRQQLQQSQQGEGGGGKAWTLPPRSNPWYVYCLLALMDVEANYIVTKAYQYTSITSVTLLDCFTIPAVMALSWLVLRSRYWAGHVCGAALCLLGLGLLVLTDRASETGGPNTLLGDALVLLGASIYAACNVAQERLLHDTSRWELLAMVSTFGTVFSSTQAALLERDAWAGHLWGWQAGCALAGFALSLFCFSLLLPSVLVMGGSAVLNLSLLTSDLWAAGARAAFFGGFGGTGPAFALAFVAEALGLGLFTWAGETRPSQGLGARRPGRGAPGLERTPATSTTVGEEGQDGEAGLAPGEEDRLGGEAMQLLPGPLPAVR